MSQRETLSHTLMLGIHKSRMASLQNDHQERYFCGVPGLTWNELSSLLYELLSQKHVSPILPV